ncbi:MAG: RnfABCDGE type electron transport complex subunit E [Acholeplasmataceae bacterium]|nr:MAG: RnfABCDGE type electron transport complex subunit E [Acholeplasmataceae bacterium]
MTEVKKAPARKAAKKAESNWDVFAKGVFKENALFIMVLGVCPALAVTATFEGAFGMGILVMLVLTFANTTISSIRKVVPNEIRIPIYIVIIATEVTILKMFVDAFAPALAQELGVFIALITVNCVILGRAESFASKNTVGKSILDGLGVALGFTLALALIGLFREFFGTGMLAFGVTLPLPFQYTLFENAGLDQYAFAVLAQSPGAFLVMGLLLAGFTAYRQTKGAKK